MFSNRIGEFKDKNQIYRIAYQELQQNLFADASAYYYENKLENLSQEEQVLELPETPPEVSHDQDIQLIQDFSFKKQDDNQKGSLLVANIDEISIFFFKGQKKEPYNHHDIEYVQAILNEIKLIHQNIHAILFQHGPELLSNLVEIQKNLDHISYITKENPYTKVVFDTSKEDLYLRLSLPQLEMYFSSNTFQRVHRSYLVNPQNVLSVDKISSKNYQLSFKAMKTSIPVSLTYLLPLKKRYSTWFDASEKSEKTYNSISIMKD